jgi:predicted ATPase
MITKFWGRNVGLLKEFSVDLGPLTFLVGKNASGKSTFLRGLRCLAMLTRLPILGERGALPLGYRATIRELFGGEEMVLGVHVETERGAGEYEITLGTDGPLVLVVGEKIEWKGANGKSFGYGHGEPEFYYMHRGNYLSSKLPRATSLPYFCFPIYRGKQQEEARKLAPLYELMDQFTPFHVYRFSPSEIARPAEPGALLAHDGAGLAAELDTLLGMDRAAFDHITIALGKLFPHIKQVNVSTLTERKSNAADRGAARSVALKGLVFERHDGKAVTAEMESDGVLLTLAHLFLASRHVSPAVGIEEPETAAYPSLLESRLNLFKTMSEGKAGTPLSQILVTTHSPTLLTMAQDPTLVRIFEHQNNGDVKIFTPPEKFMMEVIEKRLGWSVGTAE